MILNNRPIFPISDDSNDVDPLTPNSILKQQIDSSFAPEVFIEVDGYRRRGDMYNCLQFWEHRLNYYLPLLQQ